MIPIFKVTDPELAFGGGHKYMPKREDIPEEFEKDNNQWNDLAARWFFKGLNGEFIPKEGVDKGLAMRAIASVMGSFTPEHNYKISACAFMLSQWFEKFVPTAEAAVK